MDPNSLANQLAIAGVTGTYGGNRTLAGQALDANTEQERNRLAAAIAAAYAQGTDKYTLPASVTNLLDRIFNAGTTV